MRWWGRQAGYFCLLEFTGDYMAAIGQPSLQGYHWVTKRREEHSTGGMKSICVCGVVEDMACTYMSIYKEAKRGEKEVQRQVWQWRGKRCAR